MISVRSNKLRLSAAAFALFAGAGLAQAQQLAVSSQGAGGIETVVVTGTAFNPDAAPAKASLDTMEPQNQAELLLERSINHFQGANEQIAARVGAWQGRIKIDGRLNNLFTTALNSDDLRVRAAAIEVDLAGRNVAKNAASIDRLLDAW